MAIVDRGQGVFLVRVYLGRDPVTKKRLQVNVTVRGTREDAERREQLLKSQAEDGELRDSRMTVEKLLELFLQHMRHRHSSTTQYLYRKLWRLYVLPHIGSARIADVRKRHIENLVNHLLDPRKGEHDAAQ